MRSTHGKKEHVFSVLGCSWGIPGTEQEYIAVAFVVTHHCCLLSVYLWLQHSEDRKNALRQVTHAGDGRELMEKEDGDSYVL